MYTEFDSFLMKLFLIICKDVLIRLNVACKEMQLSKRSSDFVK